MSDKRDMEKYRAYQKRYREANKEKARQRNKEYWATNKERLSEGNKRRRNKPGAKEEAKKKHAAWREANKEYLAAYFKKFREDNRERLRENQRAYYAANRAEKMPAMERRRRYGLDEKTYAAMLDKQQMRCACCGRKKKLFVDHCHATGAVRGLLCLNCNTMIGHAHNDPVRLRAAARYLAKHSTATTKQETLPLVRQ